MVWGRASELASVGVAMNLCPFSPDELRVPKEIHTVRSTLPDLLTSRKAPAIGDSLSMSGFMKWRSRKSEVPRLLFPRCDQLILLQRFLPQQPFVYTRSSFCTRFISGSNHSRIPCRDSPDDSRSSSNYLTQPNAKQGSIHQSDVFHCLRQYSDDNPSEGNLICTILQRGEVGSQPHPSLLSRTTSDSPAPGGQVPLLRPRCSCRPEG